MSSVKDLKKEINNLTEAFASDGFGLIMLHPDKREDVISLISDAITLRNNQVYKLNHLREETDPDKKIKNRVHDIRKEYFGTMDKLFQELSDLPAKKTAPKKKTVKKEKDPEE
ncbi:MAG: hypothetical protein J7K46_02010 [Bacteroidales bacterium]|nr:hypothetical protein [Bacteroidales bacterium]